MALRISLCSLTGILALLLGSHDAVAIVLLHDQFLEAGPLAGKTPMPGPGTVGTRRTNRDQRSHCRQYFCLPREQRSSAMLNRSNEW